jgi:hypothetical protein
VENTNELFVFDMSDLSDLRDSAPVIFVSLLIKTWIRSQLAARDTKEITCLAAQHDAPLTQFGAEFAGVVATMGA